MTGTLEHVVMKLAPARCDPQSNSFPLQQGTLNFPEGCSKDKLRGEAVVFTKANCGSWVKYKATILVTAASAVCDTLATQPKRGLGRPGTDCPMSISTFLHKIWCIREHGNLGLPSCRQTVSSVACVKKI